MQQNLFFQDEPKPPEYNVFAFPMEMVDIKGVALPELDFKHLPFRRFMLVPCKGCRMKGCNSVYEYDDNGRPRLVDYTHLKSVKV